MSDKTFRVTSIGLERQTPRGKPELTLRLQSDRHREYVRINAEDFARLAAAGVPVTNA